MTILRRVRAFTLVESIAVVTILGAVAATVAGIVSTGADAFRAAASQRSAVEDAAIAMDRLVRELRAAPVDPEEPGTPDVTIATPTLLAFADGPRIELDGSTLLLVDPDLGAAPLCTGVERFELVLVGDDGGPLDLAGGGDPRTARAVHVHLRVGGVELGGCVFLRATLGAP